eukprot:273597-Chlamydomonas_euryale.AAC.1
MVDLARASIPANRFSPPPPALPAGQPLPDGRKPSRRLSIRAQRSLASRCTIPHLKGRSPTRGPAGWARPTSRSGALPGGPAKECGV